MKMFKTMAVILVVLFACSLTTAQSKRPVTWKTEVPFSFYVANQQMPAGVYLISRDGPFMSVTSANHKVAASFLVMPDDSRKVSHLNTLKFETHGNQQFLSGIFFVDSAVGAKLYLSKTEVEIAKRGGSSSDTAVGQ